MSFTTIGLSFIDKLIILKTSFRPKNKLMPQNLKHRFAISYLSPKAIIKFTQWSVGEISCSKFSNPGRARLCFAVTLRLIKPTSRFLALSKNSQVTHTMSFCWWREQPLSSSWKLTLLGSFYKLACSSPNKFLQDINFTEISLKHFC